MEMKDIIEDKQALNKAIIELVRDFENNHREVLVTNINAERVKAMDWENNLYLQVECEVQVR